MPVNSSAAPRYAARDLMSRLEINDPSHFPARPDVDVLYEVNADVTDPHTGKSFTAGQVIAWDYDHQHWVSVGSPDTDDQKIAMDEANETISLEAGGEVDLSVILDNRAECIDRVNGKFYRTYFEQGVQMHEEVV